MARKTLAKVKLVKVGSEPVESYGATTSKNITYAVDTGARKGVIGFVRSDWGYGAGNGMYVDRDRWQVTWIATDLHEREAGMGYYEYRDDAIDAVVRAAGLQ